MNISLLPILPKFFEKLFLKKIKPLLVVFNIPEYQFGFGENHATIRQVHRVVGINSKTNNGSSAFLDVTQAFDKV